MSSTMRILTGISAWLSFNIPYVCQGAYVPYLSLDSWIFVDLPVYLFAYLGLLVCL